MFETLNEEHKDKVYYTATDNSTFSLGKGEVKISVNSRNKQVSNIKLQNVMWVPEFRTNIMSVHSITKNGYSVTFNEDAAVIKRRDGTVVLTAPKQNDLYVAKPSSEQQSLFTGTKDDRLTRWHQRLGHLNFNDVRKMHDKGMIDGMQMLRHATQNESRCEVCDLSKIHQLPFTNSKTVEKDTLGLIHTDICGPIKTPSLGGARYFATFIDEKTSYTEVAILKEKSEIFNAFKTYKARVEKQIGMPIKKIRSDNATEYLSKEFTEYFEKEGIMRQLSTPYTPQQNGIAERANRTLVEMARTMLTQSKLLMSLWAEAVSTAAYIRNRCPTEKLNNSTPYEESSGQKPYIGFLRIFGSKTIALEKGAGTNKFMPKGKEYVLVGYSQVSKAYRLWERGTNHIVVRRDVRFHEDIGNHTMENENIFIAPLETKINTTTTNEEKEDHEEETEEDTSGGDEDEKPIGTRKRSRLKLLQTGKRGKPRRLFHHEANVSQEQYMEPRTVAQALKSDQRQL